jgi:hypothetical protein
LDPIQYPYCKKELEESELDSKGAEKAERSWDLSEPLIRWTERPEDLWTLEDAYRGTQVFGSTGGGKSSGAGDRIARAFLEAGLGGLVLCVKEEDGDYWERICAEMGRSGDLCRIRIDGNLSYNFLDDEAQAGGENITLNVAALFTEVIALVERSGESGQKDPFWARTLSQVLKHAIALETAAVGIVSVTGLTRIILAAQGTEPSPIRPHRTSSYGPKPPEDPEVKYLQELFEKARKNRPDDPEVRMGVHYFSGEFTRLAEKTRSIIVTTFTSMADSLMRPPLRSLLSEKTVLKPEATFEGKVIVVDLPVLQYHQVGLIMNSIWKAGFKRACQRRRSITNSRRPVFLFSDESHYLFDHVDARFQSTARSSLCCTVLLTQNISNYYAEIPNRDAVKSLLGSLHNKIFHQNNESETNEFAAKGIGKIPTQVTSTSTSAGGKGSTSTSMSWEYDVPERTFTNFRNGTFRNRFLVDGLLHLPGRKFSNGKTWLKFTVNQKARYKR